MTFLERGLATCLYGLPSGLALGRVERRILVRELRTGGLEPSIESGAESLGLLGMAFDQVTTLRRILTQLVKFITAVLMVVDQLPVILRDNRRRLTALVAVVGVMPVSYTHLTLPTKA